jgi:Zn-dependent protease
MQSLVQHLVEFAIIFPAIVLHEIAHGYVAYRLGDPTAKRAGRLTLNPLVHIDPMGTVPINPKNFRDERTGTLLSGIAGPTMNIVLALGAGLVSRALPAAVLAPGQFTSIGSLLRFFCYGNLILASFNLLPIPPLDGSRVVQWFLPDSARNAYDSIARYGFFILMAATWILPGLFNGYLAATVVPLFALLTGVQ